MCQYCMSVPCVSGCPNTAEAKVVAVCEVCGAEIHDGDDYLHAETFDVCEDCVDEMSRWELAELLGAERKRGDGCYV